MDVKKLGQLSNTTVQEDLLLSDGKERLFSGPGLQRGTKRYEAVPQKREQRCRRCTKVSGVSKYGLVIP